jgi:hypothetical protein
LGVFSDCVDAAFREIGVEIAGAYSDLSADLVDCESPPRDEATDSDHADRKDLRDLVEVQQSRPLGC